MTLVKFRKLGLQDELVTFNEERIQKPRKTGLLQQAQDKQILSHGSKQSD